MGLSLEGSRSGCALHGALYAALAVEGVIPIIHSTSGCGIQAHLGGTICSGWGSSGSVGGTALPSSNISEKQVVFGGTSRLREQIKNTVKVVSGDLYVVLSGCATEMVGDDIPAMCKEAREQGFPVISISTPGFRGSVYRGYELFLKEIIAQLEPVTGTPVQTITGLINILGIVPTQDVYWEGNLEEIASLLASVGLRANTLFGHGNSVEGLHNLKRAELSLVFSPWGIETARDLESRFGIPWIGISSLPVGAEESAKLLEALVEALSLNVDSVNKVSEELRRREGHFINKLADAYYIQGWQREFALIADSSIALGIATFLTTTLGLLPSLVVITDNPADQARHDLTGTVNELLPGFNSRLLFSEDRGEISDAILQRPPSIILGSSLEQHIAQRLNIPLVEVSFPVTGQLVLDKRHAGTRGALTLLEDVGRAIVANQYGVVS
jgi:nitrogenase molybdenum-iron protein beta chain